MPRRRSRSRARRTRGSRAICGASPASMRGKIPAPRPACVRAIGVSSTSHRTASPSGLGSVSSSPPGASSTGHRRREADSDPGPVGLSDSAADCSGPPTPVGSSSTVEVSVAAPARATRAATPASRGPLAPLQVGGDVLVRRRPAAAVRGGAKGGRRRRAVPPASQRVRRGRPAGGPRLGERHGRGVRRRPPGAATRPAVARGAGRGAAGRGREDAAARTGRRGRRRRRRRWLRGGVTGQVVVVGIGG